MPIAFEGREFADTRSTVLAHDTIWAPKSARAEKPQAAWPLQQEMKFEGDDRMRTDKLHRRFLPLPRQPANETVSWSQVPMVRFHEWDVRDHPLSDEDVFFMHHEVTGEEVDEEEVRHALGDELLSLIDPVATYWA